MAERLPDLRASSTGFRASLERLRIDTGSIWRGKSDGGGGWVILVKDGEIANVRGEEREKRRKGKCY